MALWVGKRMDGYIEFSTSGKGWDRESGFPHGVDSDYITWVTPHCKLYKYIRLPNLRKGTCGKVIGNVLPIRTEPRIRRNRKLR